MVISKPVPEFTAYAFQLLAELLDFRPPPAAGNQSLSPFFVNLLPGILAPGTWSELSNVPALVDLLVVSFCIADAMCII
jgi:hypothetical protein